MTNLNFLRGRLFLILLIIWWFLWLLNILLLIKLRFIQDRFLFIRFYGLLFDWFQRLLFIRWSYRILMIRFDNRMSFLWFFGSSLLDLFHWLVTLWDNYWRFFNWIFFRTWFFTDFTIIEDYLALLAFILNLICDFILNFFTHISFTLILNLIDLLFWNWLCDGDMWFDYFLHF